MVHQLRFLRKIEGDLVNLWQFCDKHYEGMWLLALGVLIAIVLCAETFSSRPPKK